MTKTAVGRMLLVGVLSSGITLCGAWGVDRLTIEHTETSSAVKVENLEKQLAAVQDQMATKDELRAGVEAVNKRLDDMRAVLLEVRARTR